MRVDEERIVVEQTLDAPADEVWAAITDVERMTRWFFENIPAFEARVGFETRFVVVSEAREFPHVWKVTDVAPGRKIAYEWTYDAFPGRALVTFTISDDGERRTLRLTNDVLEDFPDDVPEFRRESCVGGWRYFLGERLKAYSTAAPELEA